jgi:adenosylcobinamide kinase / adenosylcobinamide-phosphate guanylyltransferase
MTTTTLVLGGTRSGKSRHAQSLLPRDHEVTFIAASKPPSDEDPEWTARVERHRRDRPEGWTTVESSDITRSILYARSPVLVDCLGGWVTALIDEAELWDDAPSALALVDDKAAELAALWSLAPYDSVAVSNETGMSVVPETPAGRLFQDALGRVNTTLCAVSKQVHLVVAGRILDLSDAPIVPRNGA